MTTMDEKLEACARAAHEVNRAYCIALGDTSQVSWDDPNGKVIDWSETPIKATGG